VLAAYESPGRAYHNLEHVREVIRWFHEVGRDLGWRQSTEVFLALLFHDAVYVAGAPDNEERSAHLAREAIVQYLPQSGIDAERVAQLIRLTASHGSASPGEIDAEAALFLDCDMAILGASPDVFDQYEAAIAKEYSAIPPELFRSGRRRFLERLIAADRIYLSDYFQQRLDVAARANLRRALERLAAGN
jgi:predicted metal-dependent HD superfamily phosphohydrolase